MLLEPSFSSKFAPPFSSSSIANVVGSKVISVDACTIAIAIIAIYHNNIIVLYQTTTFLLNTIIEQVNIMIILKWWYITQLY